MGVEVKGLGWLVRAWWLVMRFRQGQAEENKACCVRMGPGDESPHTQACWGAVRAGKGTAEPALRIGKGSSGQGQPDRHSSDVIGKCSNQGSRRVSTLHHSPQEPRPQPAAVLGSWCCHGLQAPLLCDSLPPGSRWVLDTVWELLRWLCFYFFFFLPKKKLL